MTATLRLLCLILFAWLAGMAAAAAQSAGPDEAVGPFGSVSQVILLTPLQRRAIYNAIVRQRTMPAGHDIAAVVGAPVPPSAVLRDLPIQATGAPGADDDSGMPILKYAMVEDDVVVVDPIKMRVVDVIRHGGARP